MPKKRFTDTMKWNDIWFRGLSPAMKCFWQFVCDHCDNVGVWPPDFPLANFLIGETIKPEEALNTLNESKARIIVLKTGDWLVKEFIAFQIVSLRYKDKPSNLQQNCLDLIEKYKKNDIDVLSTLPVVYPITTGNSNSNSSSNSKSSKGVIGGKEKGKSPSLKKPSFDFEAVWVMYPRREKKKEALKHFQASVLNADDYAALKSAIENYSRQMIAEERETKYIQHGSTFFNNWRDYVDVGFAAPKRDPQVQAFINAAAKRDAGRAAEEAAFDRLSTEEQEKRKQAADEKFRAMGVK